MMLFRKAKTKDHKEACDIGTLCYPEKYYEGEKSFVSKIILNPDSCFVAEIEGKVVGYAISFPYVDGIPFPIDHQYERPKNTDCTYIHDVCVLPEFRKLGIASKFVEILTLNQGEYRLTAVENSENFWAKAGFSTIKEVNYCGSKASYMGLKKLFSTTR